MHARPALAALLTLCLAAPVAAQPPSPTAPARPPCGAMAAEVFAPGCDGPGTLTCDTGASLPAVSTWCACDGRTVSSASMAPPAGVRYRFRGACATTARFELTDERSERGARTGRVVVFLAVEGAMTEATRVRGPCSAAPAERGELARLTCGAGGARSVLVIREEGGAVVARVVSGAPAELTRIRIPAGQRVSGQAP